jgi:transcriptional regulator with XRE-family HTH domain
MSPNGEGQVSPKRFLRFGERLALSAENAGFNSSRLALATKTGRATMARYWTGERMMPAALLFEIADLIRVNPRWLLTGYGTRDLPLPAAAGSKLIAAFRRLPRAEQDHLIRTAELLASPHTLHSGRMAYRGEGD